MPIKIQRISKDSLQERLDAFRRTIKDDEGWDIDELAAIVELDGAPSSIRQIIQKMGWGLKIPCHKSSNPKTVLVNPKTLAKHAIKNKSGAA